MSTININDRFGENNAICSWKEVDLHFIENIRWFAWIGVPWSSWVLDDAFPRQAVPDVVARFVVRENPWTQCWHGALCQARGMALGMTWHWRTTWKLEEWKSWDLKKAGVSKELLSAEKETWGGLGRAQDVPRKMISGGEPYLIGKGAVGIGLAVEGHEKCVWGIVWVSETDTDTKRPWHTVSQEKLTVL